ncbi:MAG: hypothetical protein R2778_09980 [Saprospiraceae bacterium]
MDLCKWRIVIPALIPYRRLRIPLLAEGQSEVWLYPGVKENGNPGFSKHLPYPRTRWESKTVEHPGQTTTSPPKYYL